MSLVAGCSTPYRSVVADVEARMWCDPVELILPNVDTLNEFDWQLFVRSDDRIAADTFTLRIAVETPDSLRFEEPFSFGCQHEPFLRLFCVKILSAIAAMCGFPVQAITA